MSIFARKNIEQVKESVNSGQSLEKNLTALDVLLMGLGAIIGTGIFVVTGTAAQVAGPAIILSYFISGLVAMCVALTFTEVATMIPASGGVYTYAFVAMGEVFAWLSGCIVILYGIITIAAVCAGWSGYMVKIIHSTGLNIPEQFMHIPSEGGLINLPAIFIAFLLTFILYRGTKESVKLNSILVYVKIAIIFLFIILAVPHFNIENILHPGSYPNPTGLISGENNFMAFGIAGVMAGAAQVFFGFNGFDCLSTVAEECKNPVRDLRIGIIGSLAICMVLYMVVAALTVGLVPHHSLDMKQPLADVLSQKGYTIGSTIVAIGAVAGMTTVILIMTFITSRMIFAIARDGFLPKVLSKIHSKYNTPYTAILITGVIVSIICGFVPIDLIVKLSSMSALSSFVITALILLILRIRMPHEKRPFKCPIPFVLAPFVMIICSYLISTLAPDVGFYYILWLVVAILFYFIYLPFRKKR